MGRKAPAFLFFPNDWLGSTRRLTPAQRGYYIDLLCEMWNNGPMTEQETQAFCLGLDWVLVQDLLTQKFKQDEKSRWFNERLELERQKYEENRARQAENGKKGGRPKANRNPNHNPNETQTKPNPFEVSEKQNPLQKPSISISKDQEEEPKGSSNKDSTPSTESQNSDANQPAEKYQPQDVLECWRHYFGGELRMTEKRRKALQVRLRDRWWHDHFAEAIARASECPFLKGDNPRGWVANIEWFLRPDSATKVLEGAYQKAQKNPYEGFAGFGT